jgi:hypothetical protein
MLRGEEKDKILDDLRDCMKASTAGDDASLVKSFNEMPSVDRLVQMIRREKPYFRSEIHPLDLVKIATVTPRKLHERIKAQDGAFLLFGLIGQANNARLDGIKVEQVDIAAASKEKILGELSVMGISEKTLFPEIERTAIQIKRRYS